MWKASAVMATKLVTCPESAHLEQIEFDASPLGLLILGCSSFEPSCTVGCQRTCAARLDQKHRRSTDFDEQPTLVELLGLAGQPV
jgi:hypothetical protein